jgi:hypothetical protein
MKLSLCAATLALTLLAAPAFADSPRTVIKGPDGGQVSCQERGEALKRIKEVVCLFEGYENRGDEPQAYNFPYAFVAPPAQIIGPMLPLPLNQTRATLPLPTRTTTSVSGWLVLQGF